MTVTFKCGHRLDVPRDVQEPPKCPACGERVVTHVKNATPVFKGAKMGVPLVKS